MLSKDLSEQENLALHAEVLALQQKLGLSYKDAAHRLYTAEAAKLLAMDVNRKAFRSLQVEMEHSIDKITSRFDGVEEQEELPIDEPVDTADQEGSSSPT